MIMTFQFDMIEEFFAAKGSRKLLFFYQEVAKVRDISIENFYIQYIAVFCIDLMLANKA